MCKISVAGNYLYVPFNPQEDKIVQNGDQILLCMIYIIVVSKRRILVYSIRTHTLAKYTEEDYELELDGSLVLAKNWKEYILLDIKGNKAEKIKSFVRLYVTPIIIHRTMCLGQVIRRMCMYCRLIMQSAV
jgi:superfamily I DNA/RNA helicase